MNTNKSGRRRLGTIALAVTLSAALAACGNNESSGSSGSPAPAGSAAPGASAPAKKETKTIKIGYLAVMDDAQAILAYEAGLYEKQGLKAEMTKFNSGTDLIKAIAGGQLDAGVLGFTNALTWSAQGADLKVVGGAQMGFHSILVGKDSSIKSVADLKGKKLASQKPGSTADVVLNGVALAKANLTNKDLDMKYVEPAAAIQALQAGQVDAAFVFEPFDKIAQKQFGAKPIYEVGKEWPFPCMVMITSNSVLKKDRDLINRALDAQKEAIEMLQKDPQAAADKITKHFIEGDSLDTPNGKVSAKEVIKESIASQTFNWEINPDQVKRMQEMADIMQKQGALDKPMKVEDILDLSWQQSVKK
ncbi:ABC transporter substrate-binding protein [Paenibacillus aurantius]|uniref:ABC transporter substrate-binding protein n=1 Tax=Paenibacillus aurantius TaxID=2918900 RepID=A0AA96RGV8_9BACL|nr:ABC transporter substrate-binding protein [Paenibacillus aurantius]WNQ10469.1 ABC transporter substrate-binding protein [Paenibacillus aurantius]